MHIDRLLAAFLLVSWPGLSFADTTFVPEPETLGLIAGAAVAWAIVRWRKGK